MREHPKSRYATLRVVFTCIFLFFVVSLDPLRTSGCFRVLEWGSSCFITEVVRKFGPVFSLFPDVFGCSFNFNISIGSYESRTIHFIQGGSKVILKLNEIDIIMFQ